MTNPVKSLEYIKCYSSSSPGLLKALATLSYTTVRISRKSKTILEIRKKATFLLVINKAIIYKFFKDFTNHRKKTTVTGW